jgi:hypothetical protein
MMGVQDGPPRLTCGYPAFHRIAGTSPRSLGDDRDCCHNRLTLPESGGSMPMTADGRALRDGMRQQPGGAGGAISRRPLTPHGGVDRAKARGTPRTCRWRMTSHADQARPVPRPTAPGSAAVRPRPHPGSLPVRTTVHIVEGPGPCSGAFPGRGVPMRMPVDLLTLNRRYIRFSGPVTVTRRRSPLAVHRRGPPLAPRPCVDSPSPASLRAVTSADMTRKPVTGGGRYQPPHSRS